MRWPWVPRSALVVATSRIAVLEREAVKLRAEVLDREERAGMLAALERSYQAALSLKRQGYEPQPATPDYVAQEPMPEVITRAIAKLTRPGTPLHAQLTNFAASQVALHIDPDLIAKQIRNGADIDRIESGDIGDELPVEDDLLA